MLGTNRTRTTLVRHLKGILSAKNSPGVTSLSASGAEMMGTSPEP